jgi:hypothetical protein
MNSTFGQFNKIDKQLGITLRILYKIPYYLLIFICIWGVVTFFTDMRALISENKTLIKENIEFSKDCVFNTADLNE